MLHTHHWCIVESSFNYILTELMDMSDKQQLGIFIVVVFWGGGFQIFQVTTAAEL